VRHLSPAKDHGNLDLVLVLEESDRLPNFRTDIVFTGFGSKSNFFGFGLVGTLSRLLTLLVLVFAEIHDSADGGLFIGCNFNQVEPSIAGTVQSFVGGDDTILSTIRTYDAYWRDTDLIIDPGLNTFDCCNPLVLNK